MKPVTADILVEIGVPGEGDAVGSRPIENYYYQEYDEGKAKACPEKSSPEKALTWSK